MEYNTTTLNDIIEWDIENWSRILPFWKNHSVHLSKQTGSGLDIGARRGGLSLFLALNGINTICTDLTNPKEAAKKIHSKYNLAAKIEYKSADVLNLDFADETFDIVVFKSVLGFLLTLENQQIAINEIYRTLKKGGELLFAENLSGSIFHKLGRKAFVRWSDEWRYVEYDDIIKMINKSGFKNLQLSATGFFGAFGRTEKQRKMLGKIDGWLEKLIPERQKYIQFGVAHK
jgi:ubiquinone/menaquinone biosynthesis C-methylase UbiE